MQSGHAALPRVSRNALETVVRQASQPLLGFHHGRKLGYAEELGKLENGFAKENVPEILQLSLSSLCCILSREI